jgi:hypothetical protein
VPPVAVAATKSERRERDRGWGAHLHASWWVANHGASGNEEGPRFSGREHGATPVVVCASEHVQGRALGCTSAGTEKGMEIQSFRCGREQWHAGGRDEERFSQSYSATPAHGPHLSITQRKHKLVYVAAHAWPSPLGPIPNHR